MERDPSNAQNGYPPISRNCYYLFNLDRSLRKNTEEPLLPIVSYRFYRI